MSANKAMVLDEKYIHKILQNIQKTLKEKTKIDDERAIVEEYLKQLVLREGRVNEEIRQFTKLSLESDKGNTSGIDDGDDVDMISENHQSISNISSEVFQTPASSSSEEERRLRPTRFLRLKDDPWNPCNDQTTVTSSATNPSQKILLIKKIKMEDLQSPLNQSGSQLNRTDAVQEDRRPSRTRNRKESPWTIKIFRKQKLSPLSNVRRRFTLNTDEVAVSMNNSQNIKSKYGHLDWRHGTFSWIKFTKRSKYLPAIIFTSDYDEIPVARSITLRGTLSVYKYFFFKASEDINERLKDVNYRKALQKFNESNGCYYR